MNRKIVFLCGARDYHAMDWYRSAKKILKNSDIYILTDLIAGEGFKKIINKEDTIHKLIIIDKLLFIHQSHLGNIWRNILKILVLPLQIFLVRRFYVSHPNSIFYAHGMYYLFLANAANVPYIGTPQGSELLVRPFKSRLYRKFAVKALKGAKAITVDSVNMSKKAEIISGIKPYIIQNGIDIESIIPFLHSDKNKLRNKICSIRALTPLYRINEIVEARNSSKKNNIPLTFIYPFIEEEYKAKICEKWKKIDEDFGRLERINMYDLLADTKLVFSIPVSDSSPRSVYEAIFCGSIVAISHNPYYETLPDCMKSRIIILDLSNNNWFDEALSKAEKLINTPYIPSEEALTVFDQQKSFQLLSELFLTT